MAFTISDVDTSEALGLLVALRWIHELQLEPLDFKLDSYNIAAKLHNKNRDESELGDIVRDCRSMLHKSF
jgi:hypothetical protein